jgi:hypothetical protein
MNRDETAELLRRRQRLTGHNFDQGVLDTWADMLHAADYGAAVVAMNRAATKAGKGHVNWGEFRAELDAHERDRRDRHAESETFDCELCQGTGWKDAGPDRRGNSSVEPCTSHIRPGKVIPPTHGIAVAAAALEDEMRARGRSSHDIYQVINRWFGTRSDAA